VYPNPSSDIITIKALQNVLTSVKIFDSTGKKIRTLKAGTSSITMDVSSLKTGLYVMIINNKESLKFLKN
jgi:hypothetical protein